MKKMVSLLLCILLLFSPLLSSAEESASEYPFFSALQEFIQSFNLEKNGYNISVGLPEENHEAVLRQSNGITELAISSLGKIQLTPLQLFLDVNGLKACIDYASILRPLFSGEQISHTTEYLTAVYQQAMEYLILPFVDKIQGDDGISVHMDFDGMRFMNNLYLFLKDLVRWDSFIFFYESAGPSLHKLIPDLPENVNQLPALLDKIAGSFRKNDTLTDWGLNADLYVLSDHGTIRKIILDGFFTFRDDWYTRQVRPIRFEYSAEEKGITVQAEISLPFGYLSLSYDGNNLNAFIRDGYYSLICELNGILNQSTGEFDLEVGWKDLPSTFRLNGSAQSNELNLIIYYYGEDQIHFSIKKNDRYLQVKLKSEPNGRNYLHLDYDLIILKEPNDEYSVSLRGNRWQKRMQIADSYYLLFGPSRIVFRIHPNEALQNCMDGQITFKKSGSSVDYRIELQYMEIFQSNPTPYMFHISGEDRDYAFEFSYPYSLWTVAGTGNLRLDKNNMIHSATAQAAATYYYDPTKPGSITNLIYSPGNLIITYDRGVYTLEKITDTPDFLHYKLMHNTALAGELKMNLTDSESGKTLSAEITREGDPFAKLQIQPIEKTPVELMNTTGALRIDWDYLRELLLQLLKSNIPAWQ